MRRPLWTLVLLTVAAVTSLVAPSQPLAADVGFGNAGYASGFSTVAGRCWSRSYGFVGPWVGRGCFRPRACLPACGGAGFWFGGPGLGCDGFMGSSTFVGGQSVYLAPPHGGGASFFSGRIVPFALPFAGPFGGAHAVPYPVPYPVPVPWFGGVGRPEAVAAAVAAAGPVGPVPPQAPAARAVAMRPSSRSSLPQARRRAAVLVATGDRQLAEAAGDPRRFKAAADAYSRAAAAAADDPDIHIRHAIALVALGKTADAERAARRALALDGRLAGDPVGRMPGGATPLVARGENILQGIAATHPEADQSLATLVAAWTGRDAGPPMRLAAGNGHP